MSLIYLTNVNVQIPEGFGTCSDLGRGRMAHGHEEAACDRERSWLLSLPINVLSCRMDLTHHRQAGPIVGKLNATGPPS